MIVLRCLYDNLFGLWVDELLHLLIALVNSTSEKSIYTNEYLLQSSFRRPLSISQFCALLKVE